MFDVLILSGGPASRLKGVFKPLLPINGKPMLLHIVNEFKSVANNVIIVVHNSWQANLIKECIPTSSDIRIVLDRLNIQSPLVAALSGAMVSKSRIIFIIAADMPFFKHEVALKIVKYCNVFDACVPMWPNGYVEPLAAAYVRSRYVHVAKQLIGQGIMKAQAVIKELKTKYVDVRELCKQPDVVFHNVNTIIDYVKALYIVENRKSQKLKTSNFLSYNSKQLIPLSKPFIMTQDNRKTYI